MEPETEQSKDRQEPEQPVGDPSPPAGKSPKLPPASETWVEGQPASDADYGGGDEPSE